MKRIALSALFSTALISATYAAPVSPAEAWDAAADFLNARGIKTSDIRPAAPATRASSAPYYIYNIGDSDGFVIVAGDDRLPAVIGYSFEGRLDPESMPYACAAWLDAHAEAIKALPDTPQSKTVTYPSFTVAPLLSCKWDQGNPYNRDCPMDTKTGRRTVAGCVATAAAQVMDYYKYPLQPTGKIDYYDTTQEVDRSFDFSAMAPIAWDCITDTYTPQSPEKDCDAVAALMAAVAYGSKMNFSSGTSLAHNYDAGLGMIEYFGYDPDMCYYERALLSDDEWISLITSELHAGRPVIYGGRNPGMGHAFVCDGYDGRGYFHINWGWSGISDGYFSLSALTPPVQSTGGSNSGYSFSQTILTNIAPKGTPGLHAQEKALLNIDKLYFRDDAEFYVATDVDSVTSPLSAAMLFFYSRNKGLRPFSGEVCAAVIDGGSFSPISTVKIDSLASQNYDKVQLYLAGSSLADGRHTVGFFYRTSADSEWYPVLSSTAGAPSLCSLDVKGSQVAMSAIYPDIHPEMTSPLSHSRLFVGAGSSISFTLFNSGTVRLEGYAGVALFDTDGRFVDSVITQVVCPAEDSVKVDLTTWLTGVKPGEYLLRPFYTYAPRPGIDDMKFLSDEATKALVESATIYPASGSYFMIDQSKPTIDVRITNNLSLDWEAPLVAQILTSGGDLIDTLPEVEVKLGPSASGDFEFDCSALTLAKGSYNISFIIPDEQHPLSIGEYPLVVMSDISSVSAVEADGIQISVAADITVTSPEELASCSLYDTAGRLVADIRADGHDVVIPADGLPSGIYVLRVATASGRTAVRKLRL